MQEAATPHVQIGAELVEITSLRLDADGETIHVNGAMGCPPGSRFAANIQAAIDKGVVVQPFQTEAERQAQLRAYINQKRAQVLAGGLTWNGYRVETNAQSRENIAAELDAVRLGLRVDGEIWRMADNTDVALTNAQIEELAGAVREHGKQCFGVSWQLKAEVEAGAITSTAEIDAAPWP